MNEFLVHHSQDNVGVVIVDVSIGQTVNGKILDRNTRLQVTAINAIPLGHKIALKDLKVGDTVRKYDQDIGRVVSEIKEGAHVHVHNLKTKRW